MELLRKVTQTVVLADPAALEGQICIPAAPDARQPMASLLAAMRWAPYASWLVVSGEAPDLSIDTLRWLLSTRAPGVWATLPRMRGKARAASLAHYDFRSRPLLEELAARGGRRPSQIAASVKVFTPEVPFANSAARV